MNNTPVSFQHFLSVEEKFGGDDEEDDTTMLLQKEDRPMFVSAPKD